MSRLAQEVANLLKKKKQVRHSAKTQLQIFAEATGILPQVLLLLEAGISTVSEVLQMSEQDWSTLHIPIACKLKIKATIAQRTQKQEQPDADPTMRVLQEIAAGTASSTELFQLPREFPKKERFLQPEFLLDADWIAKWRTHVADIRLEATVPKPAREEVENLLDILDSLRTTVLETPELLSGLRAPITSAFERLLSCVAKMTGAPQGLVMKKVTEEKTKLRNGTRKMIDYASIYRAVCVEQQGPKFFRRGQTSASRGTSRTNSPSPSNKETQVCRLCGEPFSGKWYSHKPHCAKIQH